MYRIYTEDKNVSEVTAIVSKYFDGFTMFQGIGCWKGILEKSLIIEITESEYIYHIIDKVAREIKEFNKQESVLIVHVKEESNFI